MMGNVNLTRYTVTSKTLPQVIPGMFSEERRIPWAGVLERMKRKQVNGPSAVIPLPPDQGTQCDQLPHAPETMPSPPSLLWTVSH